jgi:phosphotransferase system enzyme I (PtsI)
VGEENAMIFEMHQIMLHDLDYNESVTHIITGQEVNVEYAVSMTADNFAKMFLAMEDAYMQGRATDVRDISERVLTILSGAGQSGIDETEPVIVAADDLVPSETVQLDKKKVLGFATMYGSSNSHTAILARTMNIPAIIGLGEALKPEYDGAYAVIDGFDGKIYIDPDEYTLKIMKEKQSEEQKKKALLQELKGKENKTLSGQKIDIYANIGNSSDVGLVLKNDAGGIGLFRSEFLYLESDTFPTEEEQFATYKLVAENMAGKKVIIRTLDIGADKQVDYFGLDKEENPALGYRAIRICLTRPDIFKTQLRALLRASAYGQIAIMFPMIISVGEVRQIKAILEEVKAELREAGIRFNEDMEIGIMIETPAAVMQSRELAKEVDFFSVGTNDLTQYTLAIDRQNPKLDAFYDAHHPAVLAMIRMAVESAHAEGKWIGICGELGADLELTETFLEMGIDEISVSPSMILPLRKKVREIK